MVEVLHHLLRDHVQLRALLDIIEEQMMSYGRGGAVDCDLLRATMEYTRSYPANVHEPKEILIYKRLRERNHDAGMTLSDLLAEHGSLAELTRRFATAVENGGRMMNASRQELVELANDYVSAYRRHIELEELRFFPLALKHLHINDWKEIDAAIAAPDDPLFGMKAQLPFLHLREQIRSLHGPLP